MVTKLSCFTHILKTPRELNISLVAIDTFLKRNGQNRCSRGQNIVFLQSYESSLKNTVSYTSNNTPQ